MPSAQGVLGRQNEEGTVWRPGQQGLGPEHAGYVMAALPHSPQVLPQVAREVIVTLTERYCVSCKSGSLQISRVLFGVQWRVLSATDSPSRKLRTRRFNKRAFMVASAIKSEKSKVM